MSSEADPLIGGTAPVVQNTGFVKIVGAIAAVALGGIGYSQARPKYLEMISQSETSTPNYSDWRLEKYTLNVHSGTGTSLQDFVSDVLCEGKTKCPSDLGCGRALRSWCTIGSPYTSNEFDDPFTFELHWVEGKSLNDFSADSGDEGATMMDDWIEYFIALNGENLDEPFNAFMHNKIQLYAFDLAAVLQRFAEKSLPTFQRLSRDLEGVLVLHTGVQIAGRIYEVVGNAAQGMGSTDDEVEEAVPFWSDENECPSAHALVRPLSFYAAASQQAGYAAFQGSPALMVVGISVSHHDPAPADYFDSSSGATATGPAASSPGSSSAAGGALSSSSTTSPATSMSTLYRHLTDFTGASVALETDDAACTATKLLWDLDTAKMNGLAVRYVRNTAADDAAVAAGQRSLKDYDDYAARLHAFYSSEEALAGYGGDWYGWDHLLDQHVGMWYSGSEAECDARSTRVRDALSKAGLAVGERAEPDAHEMYVGYAGPLTWEYQWEACSAGKPDAPSECACVGTNNDDDYEAATGATSCSEESDDDWCGA